MKISEEDKKKQCEWCHKEFRIKYFHQRLRRFCSVACKNRHNNSHLVYKKTGKMLNCIICSKEFYAYPSQILKNTRCCSVPCANINRKIIFKNKPKSDLHKKHLSESKKKLFREGKLKSWCKGLTKETDERVRNLTEKGSKTKKEKGLCKGEKNSMFGVHRFGKDAPTYGMKWSEETKKKIGIKSKEKFRNPEDKERYLNLMLNGVNNDEPNKLEKQFIEICQRHNLPYKFVGNFKIWIVGKNPDFINTDGQKICVEVRNPNVCKYLTKCTPEEYAKKRIDHFAKHGWKCIVFVCEKMDENEVLNALRIL